AIISTNGRSPWFNKRATTEVLRAGTWHLGDEGANVGSGQGVWVKEIALLRPTASGGCDGRRKGQVEQMEQIALFQVVRSHVWMIVTLCVIATATGYGGSFLLPEQYIA